MTPVTIDLILEHRPDLLQEISEFLVELIVAEPKVRPDHSSKAYIRFLPPSWDAIPALKEGAGWTKTGRMLLFEFRSYYDLSLTLVIGPGPDETRQTLWQIVQSDKKLFRGGSSQLYTKYTTVWKKQVIPKTDYEDASIEDLKPKIVKFWEEFLAEQLPDFEQAVVEGFQPVDPE